jgi:hypothetical protein
MNGMSISHWGIITWPDQPDRKNILILSDGSMDIFDFDKFTQYQTRFSIQDRDDRKPFRMTVINSKVRMK